MIKVFAKVGKNIQQIGGTCPEGWIEMESQRPDDSSVATSSGTWKYPTELTTASEKEQVRLVMNPIRDTFLNRLSGIAMFSDSEEIKIECAALRVALLDITKDPAFISATTYEDMEAALMLAYRSIALNASTNIRNVFRELDVL